MSPSSRIVRNTKISERAINRTIVDASDLILGRLASYVAKRVLNGEDIVVVNAEKAVVTGRKKSIIKEFITKLEKRTLGSQKKAPKKPRRPDTYLRRVVRGMLPWKQPKGKRAYRRLKVYVGVPKSLEGTATITFPDAKNNLRRSISVDSLLEIFGWDNPLETNKDAA
jgi:large subunit ribosomal protein L13